MSKFNASEYQIIIQQSEIEGESYFVGSTSEIPDVAVYEDSYVKAYESMTQVIHDLYLASVEEKRQFPPPAKRSENQVSGRITLRLPKSLHATLERQARLEDTSLNQHLVYLLADGSSRLEQAASSRSVKGHAIRSAIPHILEVNLVWKDKILDGNVVKRMMIEQQEYKKVDLIGVESSAAIPVSYDYKPTPMVGSTYGSLQ